MKGSRFKEMTYQNTNSGNIYLKSELVFAHKLTQKPAKKQGKNQDFKITKTQLQFSKMDEKERRKRKCDKLYHYRDLNGKEIV